MKTFRCVIAGSRTFNDYSTLAKKMDASLARQIKEGNAVTIISGTARGADLIGERYARDRGFQVERFPADWNRLGKAAGYRRNEEMAGVANAVVVFWDGNSPGTQHMITIAKDHRLPLKVVTFDSPA